jgi:hypothetical protein
MPYDQLQELRNRIDQGLAEADRGEGVDGDAFMQGLIDDLERGSCLVGQAFPPANL